jgi:hypothetical protein
MGATNIAKLHVNYHTNERLGTFARETKITMVSPLLPACQVPPAYTISSALRMAFVISK